MGSMLKLTLGDIKSHLEAEDAFAGDFPLRVAIAGGTVGVSCWWKGIVMAGEEVRGDTSAGIEEAVVAGKPKKKKKKTPKKGGKKDGFARGMSLRG